VSPTHEYYIVEDWFGSRPTLGTKVATITVDGAAYDVYKQTMNMAGIDGTSPYVQYSSIRQTARQCGHISISEHFKAWAGLSTPLTLGKMYEAVLLVESGGGTGSIDFTTGSVTVQ
jgi:hypothetical protein